MLNELTQCLIFLSVNPSPSKIWPRCPSQFEQHIRAILDLPLGRTDSKAGGVMVNLVGAENHTGNVVYENIEKIMRMDGVTPHIYGKKQTRPFRKMGHVTIIHEDLNEARKIAEAVKKAIKVISE